MKFEVIGFENKTLWEEITKKSDIYNQWQYVDAFYKNGDGIPKLAYAKQNDEYVLNVFLIRNVAKDLCLDEKKYHYYDITTPYGYGGIDTTSDNFELLEYFFLNFEKYCENNKIISEFIRINPLLEKHNLYNCKYEIINVSKTVYMKLENEEQIWNDLESRCRNTIRKAQKNNLTIKSGFDKKMLEEFISIYNETMKRDNAEPYYFFGQDFFKSILENLKEYAKIYTVYYNNKAINSSIILFNNQNAHYHLSGSLSDYMHLGANNFALYEIALDLCQMGCKKFHLGGGYGGDTSPLLKFKRSFNKFGDLNFYIGKRKYDLKAYGELCDLKNIIISESYFPAYRKEKS